MRRDGFTLIELLVVTTLLVAASGMIWQTWFTANESIELLDKQVHGADDALRAMAVVGQELRQASRSSLSGLPANRITYRIAEDLDGSGLPVDAAGNLELSQPRTIQRDYEDHNQDGLRDQQLILITPNEIRVLANGLAPPASEGPDPGIWLEQSPHGVRLRLQMLDQTRRGRLTPVAVEQHLRPRNP